MLLSSSLKVHPPPRPSIPTYAQQHQSYLLDDFVNNDSWPVFALGSRQLVAMIADARSICPLVSIWTCAQSTLVHSRNLLHAIAATERPSKMTWSSRSLGYRLIHLRSCSWRVASTCSASAPSARPQCYSFGLRATRSAFAPPVRPLCHCSTAMVFVRP